LSGHHRVDAAKAAGEEWLLILFTDRELSRQEQIAIQLSHNAISGEDEPTVLRELWGELVALGALGGMDYDAALKLLYERGLKVEEAWEKAPWHALAVTGLAPEALQSRLAALPQPPTVAALLSPDHFVLTGEEALLQKLHAALGAAGRNVKVTPVEPGWHWPNPALDGVNAACADALGALELEHLSLSIQGAYEELPVRAQRDWPAHLKAHGNRPLDWTAAVRRLKAQGMNTAIEIGHGSSLGSALHKLDHDVRVLATEDNASFAQAVKLAN
jgi:malonyl CoA-acyl carrier protein transacylase